MKSFLKNHRCLILLMFFMISMYPVFAQENPGKDPLQAYLFPPELVMQHQNDIQLKQEQKDLIIGIVEDAQKKFSRLQWDLQAEVGSMQKLLAEQKVNEMKVLEQLDKVLDDERQIKRVQITLMVRVKNVLTDDQKTRLNTYKEK